VLAIPAKRTDRTEGVTSRPGCRRRQPLPRPPSPIRGTPGSMRRMTDEVTSVSASSSDPGPTNRTRGRHPSW
jgi:hypothetical protein